VNSGFAVDPEGPAPARADMAGDAALVWEVTPAEANSSGPRERDTILTRYVVRSGDHAEVVAERGEAVMAGGGALWHLVGRDLPVERADCAAGGKRARFVDQQIVFESLAPRPRRLFPMKAHVEHGEWARLDLEAMVGPWVVETIDRAELPCEGRPLGSPYVEVVDLDEPGYATLKPPAGALLRYRDLVGDVIARGCGVSADQVEVARAALHYDREGNLVVDYGFTAFTAPVCFGGVPTVLVGTYDLPPGLSAHGRLPGWLRRFLADHPSPGVSVMPVGREGAARKELERLPKVAPRLPRDSRRDRE
jgi:hypothetical protein